MPPKKQNISEETFQTFKREIERSSQHIVNQLLQKIVKIVEKYTNLEEKCKKIENQHKNEIEELKENYYSPLQNLEQQN